MKQAASALAMVLALAVPVPALAQVDQYGITAQEHAACDADAASFCSDVNEDANSLITCMKANRRQLSPMCDKAFTNGLRKRNLPL